MTSTTPAHSSPPTPQATSSAIPPLSARIPKLEPRKRRPPPSNSIPLPETPALPPRPAASSYAFKVPTRRILSKKDHDLFLNSPTYFMILAWIFGLARAVVDTPASAVKDEDLSDNVKAILSMLQDAEAMLSQCPPDEQGGSRFGNKAFQGFLDLARDRAPTWHKALGLKDDAAIAEVSTYLNHSFGNRSRIDYGSGHELNFLVWLLCLYQLDVLQASDFKAIVLRVFRQYLSLMRLVQMTYYLEPAGSHGVWGLDDYQFLPFLFGAAQLLNHPYITPRAIHQDLSIEESGDDFLYLDQVRFVNSTKTVKGLRWHSPLLDDISSAKSWSKIDGGMRRMFVAEVLGKLPVMQHFLFGSIVPAADGMSQEEVGEGEENDSDGHAGHDHLQDHGHDGTGWGDCCGIKVPSSIAAAQEARKMGKGDSLRRIPFD
ncbi:hypothetical protein S40285_01880 [Stachybotrys chlorohalonatus IBT 40285]|uniref:Serine/threonine-protein phosphatase 2A activator n=1 Tax=Stachybotrys chlorohalonatus (strain IBT 40285) TaxID=1283841 RepID=A0A084QQM2_STAC4|nr:hypothetical protein S40285_01880 [Stachybotrys chlorohalonata IBT 40285]